MESYIKTLHEVLTMAESLPEDRFDALMRLFWAAVLVAGVFGVAALVTALRWW